MVNSNSLQSLKFTSRFWFIVYDNVVFMVRRKNTNSECFLFDIWFLIHFNLNCVALSSVITSVFKNCIKRNSFCHFSQRQEFSALVKEHKRVFIFIYSSCDFKACDENKPFMSSLGGCRQNNNVLTIQFSKHIFCDKIYQANIN